MGDGSQIQIAKSNLTYFWFLAYRSILVKKSDIGLGFSFLFGFFGAAPSMPAHLQIAVRFHVYEFQEKEIREPWKNIKIWCKI